MARKSILVTGANGQLGTVLTQTLRQRFGQDAVLATDIRPADDSSGPFEMLDVTRGEAINALVEKYQIGQIYHLAAILSAKGEANPLRTWQINMDGLLNVLEVARKTAVEKVFFPSSIAVFGHETPKNPTPQVTIMNPETAYGVSKVSGEKWCHYYHYKYGVDVRSLRYPGIIGYQSLPGGGTTDYAVDIFYAAIRDQSYQCFLDADTRLPMIYMEDAIRATIELMEADVAKVKTRTSYNLAAMSFTPAEIAQEILQYIPEFEMTYRPDYRQEIAATWPTIIDDQLARKDWGWMPKYDLPAMTKDMIRHLQYKNSFQEI